MFSIPVQIPDTDQNVDVLQRLVSFCLPQPLRAASWSDMALLLYPFPPGHRGGMGGDVMVS